MAAKHMIDSDPKAKPELLAILLFWAPIAVGGLARLFAGTSLPHVQGAAGVVVAIVSLAAFFIRRGRRFAGSYLFVSAFSLALGCLYLWPAA